MLREQVTSSSVRAVGYDAEAQALEIEFNNGGCYRYEPVIAEQYAAFRGTESLGRAMVTFKTNPEIGCARVYPCCGIPFDAAAVTHACAVAEVA
jgi:hypothetical protein